MQTHVLPGFQTLCCMPGPFIAIFCDSLVVPHIQNQASKIFFFLSAIAVTLNFRVQREQPGLLNTAQSAWVLNQWELNSYSLGLYELIIEGIHGVILTALLNCLKVFCFKQLHYLIKTRLSFKKIFH